MQAPVSQRIIPAASMSQGLGALLQGCSQRRGAAAIGQERSWPWPGHKHQGLGSAELDLPQSGGEGEKRHVLSDTGGQSQPGCPLHWSVLVSQAPSSKCALGMSPDLRHKHGTAELGGVGGSSDMDQGTFTSWSGWRLQRHLFICITAQVITSLHQHRWMGQQPRGASSGKTKRSYLHPALKHGHAERCVWFLAVCGAQGCAGGIPWSFRWVR